jgi:crotonobetainyl-CoA:carnitine CoA-transferase CaiB-like acyl-CoA transferase
VLDITLVWAGPYGTMMLGDLGAEVIRVESINRFPVFTRGLIPRPSKEMVAKWGYLVSGFPDLDPGQRPWNRFSMFNCHARNKLSMTVDLSRPKGRDIFKRLVARSDVVVENNSAGVMDKLGIGYRDLKEVKADIAALGNISRRWPAIRSSGGIRIVMPPRLPLTSFRMR